MRGCFNYNIPNNNSNLGKEWNLIIVRDKDRHVCDGKQIITLLQILQPLFNINVCFLGDDIDGHPKKFGFWDILAKYQRALSVDECAEFLSQVNLEWGNIFLFKEEPANQEFYFFQDSLVKIAQAKVTLRVADENYVLIYTLDASIFETVKKEFPMAEVEKGKLMDLWYPC